MRHSEIRRACHDAAFGAMLVSADHDARHTEQSLNLFDTAAEGIAPYLYGYCRERSFPKAEILWRKAHEFRDLPVERDWTLISESTRVYFTVFGSTAAALEPIHEEDPEGEEATDDGAVDQEVQGMVSGQIVEEEAQASSEEPGATGSGEVDQGGQAPEPAPGTEGDPANAGDVTEPPVDHSLVAAEAEQNSLVVPPVDHSAATPEAEAAQAKAEASDTGLTANVHGIGPDEASGPNPDYQPEDEAAVETTGEVEAAEEPAAEPEAAATEDAEPEAPAKKSRAKK